MSSMQDELQRVGTLLGQLKTQAASYDSDKNNQRKDLHASLFNAELFKTRGKQLAPFVEEAQRQLAQLEQQLARGSANALVRFQCDKLLDQCKALAIALNSAGQRQKSTARDQQVRKLVAQKKARNKLRQGGTNPNNQFEWLTASVMANSHQLYQELSKHHGYERKLAEKIALLENRLANYQGSDKITLQQDILKQHKRLGQCRKAIHFIEQRIQQMESGRR